MKKFLLLACLPVLFWVDSSGLWARPRSYARHVEFQVSPQMRGRVDFWIDIFTKYGEHQEVLHHRDYPQVVFRVLDFRRDAERLGPIELDKFKKTEIRKNIQEIAAACKLLSAGRNPGSSLEKHIARQMSSVPGGTAKFAKVVKEQLIRNQRGIREKYELALKRSGLYMHIIEHIFVRENGLPLELTRLPFIESSFDYSVRSSVGAAGIWQFMPRTARSFMTVSNILDERLDVIESTRAAARYLADAHQQLGSWPLAITSYNHGIAGVRKRVQVIGTRDITQIVEHPNQRVFGFASNNFFPELLAALDVYDNYQQYFPGLQPEQPVHIKEFRLPHSFSAQYLVKQLKVEAETLKSLNLGVSSRVWNGLYRLPKGYNLKVPLESREHLAALLKPEPAGPAASSVYGGIVYKVRKGDNLTKIAAKFNTTVANIKALNGLTGTQVYVGQKLLVKKPTTGSKSSLKPSQGKSGLPGTYKVKPGDTLSGIGRRFGVPVAQLQSLNNLKSSNIKAGQVLKIGGTPVVVSSGGSKTYQVKSGDSLWSISRKYKVSVGSLKKANNLKGNNLKAGQRLKIP